MAVQITQDFTSQIDSVNNSLSNYVTKANAVSDASLVKAIGNISNPLFSLPLKNSLTIERGVGSVTFSRSTTGTYIDRYGVLQTAAVDEPRFEEEGLLIEGEGHNYLLQTRDLTSGWTTSSLTPALDATGLDGVTNSCSSLTASAAGATIMQSYTGTAYTFYARVKRKTGTGNVYITVDNGTTWVDITSNLSTSSWYLYKVENTTMTNPTVGFKIDASSDAIIVDTIQLEEKPFATSYIPTTDTTVTRSADICYVTYAGNVPDIVNGNFSMACDFDVLGDTCSDYRIILATNYYFTPLYNMLRINSGSSYIFYYRNGSAINGGLISSNTLYRVVTTVDSSDLTSIYTNGAKINSGIRSLVNTNYDTTNNKIGIGCTDNSNLQLYGHISNIKIYNFALTDQESALA
jgi:hypothetical protein